MEMCQFQVEVVYRNAGDDFRIIYSIFMLSHRKLEYICPCRGSTVNRISMKTLWVLTTMTQ